MIARVVVFVSCRGKNRALGIISAINSSGLSNDTRKAARRSLEMQMTTGKRFRFEDSEKGVTGTLNHSTLRRLRLKTIKPKDLCNHNNSHRFGNGWFKEKRFMNTSRFVMTELIKERTINRRFEKLKWKWPERIYYRIKDRKVRVITGDLQGRWRERRR